MLVGVAFLPPSFPPSETWVFYIIKRKNCVYFCNTVYELTTVQRKLQHFTLNKSQSISAMFKAVLGLVKR